MCEKRRGENNFQIIISFIQRTFPGHTTSHLEFTTIMHIRQNGEMTIFMCIEVLKIELAMV